MSLMFAALKALEQPAAEVGLPTAPAPVAPAPARRWLWPALALGGGVLLAGGWVWASAVPAAEPPPAVAAAAQAPAPPSAPSSAPGNGAPDERSAPSGDAEASAVEVPDSRMRGDGGQRQRQEPAHSPPAARVADAASRLPPLPSPPAPAPVPAPAPAPASAPAPARTAPPPRALVAEVSVRDAASARPEGQQVARRVAAIGAAIHAGDFAAARAQLARLEERLPARSLTLLRMQAWLAHESGDAAAAMALYRRIVARMPGDETAVINLAILEAGNGQVERARERLRQLRARDTDSHAVERAIRLVGASLE